MKDENVLRLRAMTMIGIVYAAYMTTSAVTTGSVPDGILLGVVAGALGALAGYDIATRQARAAVLRAK